MTCSLNSGGARFYPPEEDSFRLCVRPLDPLETHPIYIGMVPAGVNGSEVNFINDRKEGIFLRMGGFPAGSKGFDGPPLDEADPSRPEFLAFGERSEASLPMPEPDCGIALHYFQSFPRCVSVTEKIQCKGCKMLLDSPEEFAEHCFEDAAGHGDEFGFDSCRRVEVVDEGDYDFDPHLARSVARFQVEKKLGERSQAEAFCEEPQTKELRNGVPPLPRELPELVGGRATFGPVGPWQPCVLLCVPGTRVEVSWLATGRPTKPALPRKIRAAAGGSQVKVALKT